ncbi:MAG: phenylalanine--tRNA ligase beta subunit-related protein [Coriobacteriia bacterium]|nr:phenylalanine--tRNA ligase beta subunit-related protein [Coriobacteriia bacterium]
MNTTIPFSINPAVREKLPGICVGLVEARGVDNSLPDRPAVDALLDDAVRQAEARLADTKASDDPRVQPYRAAFHALGMSPSRYPSSNIALLRRIAKGKGLWRVNPVVDLGNAISIGYGLPLGAHAMAPGEPLELRFSRNGDRFVELGAAEDDPTLEPGELVYAAGNLVHTRRWTWRQSENGKVEATAGLDLLFPIDGFLDVNEAQVMAACEDLAQKLRDIFGCEADVRLCR